MSQELERVYTINLGKVLLSPDNQRAKRAINMIREFARRHMKTEEIKIEEDVAHQIWSKGIRSPPRKIRVRMSKTEDGAVLVSRYEEGVEEAVKPATETPPVEEKAPEPESEEEKAEKAPEPEVGEKAEQAPEPEAEKAPEPEAEKSPDPDTKKAEKPE